jgi:hypothetical protein
VQVAATNRAGRRTTVKLAPVVVAVDAAPTVSAQLAGGSLTWQATDPGTPSLALHVDFVDPTGVNPPQSVDLGAQPLAGSTPVVVPPGTWQASLVATNTSGLATTVDLGPVSA